NRQDRFNHLYWDGDGFLLSYKRIENGKLKWPRTKDEVRPLTNQQVRWLLEGLSIAQPRAILPGKKGVF
ncbi:IS66 family insertion sequence element accessory protein TnpB, partial [Enterococcus faecium]|uniref:IS66 family insertion sequence element accessory protein TnpB n=1 Tax=Enterococcus faecium TaxID=1352 RepID=UPI0010C15AAA